MAAAVASIAYAVPENWRPLMILAILVPSSALIYAGLLFLAARERLASLLRAVKPLKAKGLSWQGTS